MNRFWLLIPAALWLGVGVHAQQTASPAANSMEAERARIRSERVQQEEQFEQQIQACYQRFAVNDCLRRAKVQRRAVLERLQREEASIKDAQRQHEGAERLKQLQERAQARTVPQAPAVQGDPPLAPAPQSPGVDGERPLPGASAAQTPERQPPAGPRVRQGPTAQSREEAKKRFEEKQRQAQEHRDQRDRALAEKEGKPSRPLPIPP